MPAGRLIAGSISRKDGVPDPVRCIPVFHDPLNVGVLNGTYRDVAFQSPENQTMIMEVGILARIAGYIPYGARFEAGPLETHLKPGIGVIDHLHSAGHAVPQPAAG